MTYPDVRHLFILFNFLLFVLFAELHDSNKSVLL